jgi:hypothetical protein
LRFSCPVVVYSKLKINRDKLETDFLNMGTQESCSMTQPADAKADQCSNCRFWRQESESVDDYGECRIRAPQFVKGSGFRSTRATTWCGEHERKADSRPVTIRQEPKDEIGE